MHDPDPTTVDTPPGPTRLALVVALAYASDLMGREIERLRAAGLIAAADVLAAERTVIDDERYRDR